MHNLKSRRFDGSQGSWAVAKSRWFFLVSLAILATLHGFLAEGIAGIPDIYITFQNLGLCRHSIGVEVLLRVYTSGFTNMCQQAFGLLPGANNRCICQYCLFEPPLFFAFVHLRRWSKLLNCRDGNLGLLTGGHVLACPFRISKFVAGSFHPFRWICMLAFLSLQSFFQTFLNGSSANYLQLPQPGCVEPLAVFLQLPGHQQLCEKIPFVSIQLFQSSHFTTFKWPKASIFHNQKQSKSISNQTHILPHPPSSHSHPICLKALSAASEARHLEELNDAVVPKLYAQLYELRRAGDAWWRLVGGWRSGGGGWI